MPGPGDHVDVVIVGAGLSGIGSACHLQLECPDRDYLVLESRDAIGGTWDLFRYPGVRSDSDMFTLGYSFRPWTATKSIADGQAIREYVRDTARQFGVTDRIRFGHRVVRAEWDSDAARWTVHAQRTDTGEPVVVTCEFLFTCCGYYRYDEGYSPEFPGRERFRGTVVHPQHWPEDLDVSGRRVVVVGSGATAVTLVPALAGDAEHVTMLQRSPSYVLSIPSVDGVAERLQRRLPHRVVYPVVRWKNVLVASALYQLSRRRPAFMRKLLQKGVTNALPAGYDIQTHFGPEYEPWDQRLCFVPDGDLFQALHTGKAEVVTDTIETFTEDGIRLASGRELAADVVVTATGLNLLPIGGMQLAVDGQEVSLPETVAYKGMMLSGVPNFALAVGYTNASWTLKCDLVGLYVCRLLDHMREHGYRSVTPRRPSSGELSPLIDLKSGYVRRGAHLLPKQGPDAPWRLYQNYPRDLRMFRHGDLTEGVVFAGAREPVAAAAPA